MADIPAGKYGVWADDDDVIGLTIAKSYPSGWPIICTEPASVNTPDELEVAQFLAWCLANADRLTVHDPVLDLLQRTAPVNVTACPTCGGEGTVTR